MDPLTLSILMGSVDALGGVFSAVSDYAEQMQNYKLNKMKWQDEVVERRENYIFQKAQLEQQMVEVDTAAASEALNRKLELQREQSRLSVVTGEHGLEGNIVQRLLVNAEQAAGRDLGTTQYNKETQIRQIKVQGEALRRQAKAPKLYQLKPSKQAMYIRAGLSIGKGAMSGASAYGKTK